MKTILQVILVVDAVMLVTLILLQNRGTSLGSAFGGGDSSVHYERRGGEKVIHYITILAVITFVGVSLGSLFVQ